MEIIVENEQEKQLVTALCDVALKSGGLQNIQGVQIILKSIKDKERKDGEKRDDEVA